MVRYFIKLRLMKIPEYVDKSVLNVKDILEFADTVKIEDVKEILDRQITMNSAISDEASPPRLRCTGRPHSAE